VFRKNFDFTFIISATGIVPQSLFKNLKILDLENTLVVEIQKGILLYSCHIVRKFLNIDTEHKTQKSQNYLIVLSVKVYVLQQNCRAAGGAGGAGWRWDSVLIFLSETFFPYFFHVLSVDIKNWDKNQICIKSKFKNIHCVNLAFYK
jgi:hypothetical protein